MNSTVKLINHASAKINVDGISIISDPWYDNEWGFSNRMCDTAIQIASLI